MQLLKNSGYDEKFRAEILNSGLKGYNKIVEAERDRIKPMYRPKGWNTTARWLAKRRKKKNWLGPFWKSAIFVPPTPGSELKKQMQAKESTVVSDEILRATMGELHRLGIPPERVTHKAGGF